MIVNYISVAVDEEKIKTKLGRFENVTVKDRPKWETVLTLCRRTPDLVAKTITFSMISKVFRVCAPLEVSETPGNGC